MKKSIIICMVGVAVMMSSCRIYKAYERPEDLVTDGLYRDPLSDADTLNAIAGTTFGDLPWRDVFTDTQLQAIIEQALENKWLLKMIKTKEDNILQADVLTNLSK